jgi:hypothetical protein
MVSGLAPAMFADTEMVAESTAGNGETDSLKYAVAPASTIPAVKRVVATGLRTNTSDRFT